MSSASSPKDAAALAERLLAAEKQLQAYARDLNTLQNRGITQAAQLESAYRQLQLYARDLKTAYLGEQQRRRDLERAQRDSVMRLFRASRVKDNETASHLRRVKHLSRLVAVHLGWDHASTNLLAFAAPMHDVGKIGVPDAILHKNGPLTEDEWKVMKQHPTFGASLLRGSGSPLLEMAHDVALCHHERWDGSGYPSGLKTQAIPRSARIVAIVDVYDALRIQRPYKPAYTHLQASEVILNGDGRTLPQHFDPKVLQAFRELRPTFEAIHARIAQ
jgi:putative two-component system response regulator